MSKFDLFKRILAVWIVITIIKSSLAALLPNEKSEICNLDQFTCNDGKCIPMEYRCDHVTDCNDNSDEEMCQTDKCPRPKTPVNGRNQGECCFVNDVMKFSCLDSYELNGEAEIKCLDDGSWNASVPKCSKICTDEQFKCSDGSCLPRSWVCDNATDCADEGDEKDCGTGCTFPSRFENLIMEFENPEDKSRLTVAPDRYILRFQCKTGYQISGPKFVICLAGEWSETFPYCLRLYCEQPPAIENGSYQVIKGIHPSPIIDSRTLYSCSKGFELENRNVSELKCRLNGTSAVWNGEIPRCREKDMCPDPGKSPDGERHGNCCHKGDVVRFSCEEGFEMIGQAKIECLPGGFWSAPRALCKPPGIFCPSPPEIRNGRLKIYGSGDFATPGIMAIVRCDEGYSMQNGSDQLDCQIDGQWNGKFGTCAEVPCKTPVIPEHGDIVQLQYTNATTFPHGFHLRYTCDDGYKMIGGSSWNICDGAKWKYKTPKCERITCYDPGTPANGNRQGSRFVGKATPENNNKTGSSFEVKARVTYSCFDGYTLLGSYERFCLRNGQWSGETARCNLESNYCPDPGVPINGIKTGQYYGEGSIVTFQCHSSEFFLLGSETRVCQHNHEWSGEEARCKGPNEFDNNAEVLDRLNHFAEDKSGMQEQELKKYERSLRKALPDMLANATLKELEEAATRTRSPLFLDLPQRIVIYFLFDASGSIDEENFNTSIEFAKALVKKVGVSEGGIRVGALSFSSKASIHFLPVDHTETESVLGALDQIPYTTGGTHISIAFEKVKLDMIPVTDEILGNVTKSVIFILTDGKANMGGDPQLLTKELQRKGVEIYCVGITGNDEIPALYKIASEPDNVFVLHDYGTMSWLIQKITYGTIDYSECGLSAKRRPSKRPERNEASDRARIHGGTKATQSWPWMAALFFVTNPRTNEKRLGCGGSIIAKEWILTAAHCLIDGENNHTERSFESVIIKLGLVDLNNDSNAQRFRPKKFVIHELYNTSTIDYDIGLIKVDRVIEFGEYIRPVCLPPAELPKDTNLYKPAQTVTVIGWGDTRQIKPDEKNYIIVPNLKEATLPIQPDKKCRDSISKKFRRYVYTDRMLCAGDGSGEIDACHGDSGGPMMQRQLSEEKNDYWVQIGIVSWGIGCAQRHTYGFYTKVHILRDWIQQKASST